MRSRPVIGITLDSEDTGGYSPFPWYALRQNYCHAVASAGGLPLALPHEPDLAEPYLERIHGLVVTGGAFDVDPALFGAAERHAAVKLKTRRTQFELAMIRGALARRMPILGICGGQQLLNVVLGGTLIQHIPDAVPDALAHEQSAPRDRPGHPVELVPGTLLSTIAGCLRAEVNSSHHQAVKDVAPGCVVNARAPDGVIEGIEDPRQPFCIGVQWHPEFTLGAADAALFTAFIEACRQ